MENYNSLKKGDGNLPPNFKQIIEDLKQFKATYDIYNERGYEKSIPREVGRAAKRLRKRLELIKNEAILGIILKHTGYSWEDLIEFAKSHKFSIAL